MLEAKTLTIKKSTNSSGKVVNFIPEMVEDKEVYSVVNKNNEHCGYITEDLFNLLMEQDPEEKENKALIHRALGVDDEEKEEESLIFGKKIILDVSSTKDINISSSEKSTKKDYYMIGSATNGVDLGNSEITFLDDGSDKCSYLEAKGLLHAYSSKLHIGGANKINGNLTYSGNERKKALLILRNLTSHSNLNIKSSTDGLFNFIDTTISNGKKIITIEERCNLINTSIENEGKKDLELTAPRIRHSKLKNVSSLKYVDISNSDVENLSINVDDNNSKYRSLVVYGPMEHRDDSDYVQGESTELLCSLKNTTIEFSSNEAFHVRTNDIINISNSVIKGYTDISVAPPPSIEGYSLSIDNSLLDGLQMTLGKSKLSNNTDLDIKNSELKGTIAATGLEKLENSIISSSFLTRFKTIRDCVIENADLKAESNYELIGYNSYQNETQEPKKDVGKVTSEMELL